MLKDQARRVLRLGGENPADARERHVDLAQRADEPGLLKLVGVVVAVARIGIDVGRRENAKLRIQPRRLEREPRRAGERADREQAIACVVHARSIRPAQRGESSGAMPSDDRTKR